MKLVVGNIYTNINGFYRKIISINYSNNTLVFAYQNGLEATISIEYALHTWSDKNV